MTTKDFLGLLEENTDKSLLFEYAPGQRVPPSYHITEVKNIHVDAVDCGARTDSWKETVVQLWESPKEKDKTEFMSVFKALGILKKVDRMKPMERESEIKFEYGNSVFHTAQLNVSGYEMNEKNLVVRLSVAPTDCKAKDECGVPETANEVAACTPGSGCC
ncbi:MAG: DUF6428 family protein [Flavobacteriaceae bacterium]